MPESRETGDDTECICVKRLSSCACRVVSHMNGTLGKNNYRLDICIGGSGGKSENDKKMWEKVYAWTYV